MVFDIGGDVLVVGMRGIQCRIIGVGPRVVPIQLAFRDVMRAAIRFRIWKRMLNKWGTAARDLVSIGGDTPPLKVQHFVYAQHDIISKRY
jgi:hypothetical protein